MSSVTEIKTEVDVLAAEYLNDPAGNVYAADLIADILLDRGDERGADTLRRAVRARAGGYAHLDGGASWFWEESLKRKDLTEDSCYVPTELYQHLSDDLRLPQSTTLWYADYATPEDAMRALFMAVRKKGGW